MSYILKFRKLYINCFDSTYVFVTCKSPEKRFDSHFADSTVDINGCTVVAVECKREGVSSDLVGHIDELDLDIIIHASRLYSNYTPNNHKPFHIIDMTTEYPIELALDDFIYRVESLHNVMIDSIIVGDDDKWHVKWHKHHGDELRIDGRIYKFLVGSASYKVVDGKIYAPLCE